MNSNINNDNKVCFLIPIIEPHYKYLNFINNINSNYKFSIYFVSTTIIERENLKIYLKRYKKNKIYKNLMHICLEDNLLIKKYINDFNSKQNGIINIKKLYKLYYLNKFFYKRFHYIAVIDAEIMFIDLNNLYHKFKKFCSNKIIICGNVSENKNINCVNVVERIHNNCLNFIKNTNHKSIINNETKNGYHYFWFSDIPIYNTKYLNNFFENIEFNENEQKFKNFIKKMNFNTFDYVIYIYWCILRKHYRLICMNNYNINRFWSLESSSYKIYKQVKNKIGYTTNMVIANCYNNNKNKFIDNKPILIYHLNDPVSVYHGI